MKIIKILEIIGHKQFGFMGLPQKIGIETAQHGFVVADSTGELICGTKHCFLNKT